MNFRLKHISEKQIFANESLARVSIKLSKLFYIFIGIFSFLLSNLIFVFSLKGTINTFPFFTIAFGIIVGGFILLGKKYYCFCRTTYFKKITFIVAITMIVAAVLLRFYPVISNLNYICENNNSDSGVHYYAAQQLSKGYLQEHIINYEKLFPFLFPYSLTLSFFNRLCFFHIDLAIVVSNFIFDALGGLFLYLFLKKIKKGSEKIGLFFWIINPFSIIFCWIPMNLVLTSSLLMCIIYVSYIFLGFLKKQGILKYVFACVIGLLLFLANMFRPVYTVIFIALCLTIVFDLLKRFSKEKLVVYGLCIVLLSVFLFAPTLVLNRVVENRFNDDLMGSSGSWNFFVGANYKTAGRWSLEDSRYFFGTVKPQYDTVTSAFAQIKNEGIERYKQMDIKTLMFHFSNKFDVLFGDIPNSAHNTLLQTLNVNSNRVLYTLCRFSIGLFFTVVSFLSTVFLLINCKSKSSSYQFIKLCYIGLSVSFLLVEVMNRYSSIIYSILIILTAFAIDFYKGKSVINNIENVKK